jgi:hypothetical protein
MRKLWVAEIICVLALQGARLSGGQTPPATAALTVQIVDFADPSKVLPGVNVTVLNAERRELASGPTDGRGEYHAKELQAGRAVQVEYRLGGFVRNPERLTVTVRPPETRVVGRLLSREDRGRAYLHRVADALDRYARAAPEAERRAAYGDLWEMVEQLPVANQAVVAQRLSDVAYLMDRPSFLTALRRKPGSLAGELVRVDADAKILIIRSADGTETTFAYGDATDVGGGSRSGVAGLATRPSSAVVVHFVRLDDNKKYATKIDVQDRP